MEESINKVNRWMNQPAGKGIQRIDPQSDLKNLFKKWMKELTQKFIGNQSAKRIGESHDRLLKNIQNSANQCWMEMKVHL